MIVLFSVYSFFSFYKGRLGNLVRHEVLFQDVARDGSTRFKAWSCIRNNSNQPIRFDLDQSHVLMPARTEYDSYYRYRAMSERGAQNWTQEARVQGVVDSVSIPAYVGSYCFLEETWMGYEAKPPFEAKLRLGPGGLEGQIVDHTRIATPESTFILYRQELYGVDDQLRVGKRSSDPGATARAQAAARRGDVPRGGDSVSAMVTWAAREAAWTPWQQYLGQVQRDLEVAEAARRADLTVLRRTDRDAVVFICYEEQGKRGGLPVSRVTCMRRVVDVVSEENDHD